MLYFFQRDEAVLRCEIRLEWEGEGYELLVHRPDSVCVERFREWAALMRRWAELEGELVKEGWCEPAAPR